MNTPTACIHEGSPIRGPLFGANSVAPLRRKRDEVHLKTARRRTIRRNEAGQQQQSRRARGREFRQCRLARSGSFGHGFEKFRLPYRFALPSRVNFPSPRFRWTTFVFDSEVVVVHRTFSMLAPRLQTGSVEKGSLSNFDHKLGFGAGT